MNQKVNDCRFIASRRGLAGKFMLCCLFLFASVGFAGGLRAQNGTITVTGQVVDAMNMPLIGVNVMEVGTTNGTITDFDGNYSLTVARGAKVSFSYIGYKTQEKPAASVVNVTMTEDATMLDEVVAVAYGTQRKADLTGAISVVDADQMKKLQTADIGSALQGLAPGVSVTTSGLPGGTPDINIRGIGSFGSTGPLYVIDGVIMDGTQREFNMNDVESVQILKDAASAALYGSRGANGVILITTKKGKAGETRIDVSGRYGISQIAKRIDMMQTLDFLEVQRLAYENADKSWPGKPEYGQVLYNTNWQDEFYKLGHTTDINVNVSGGNEHGNYMFSANFYDQDGVVEGPSHRRFNIRSNSEARKGIFTIGENLTFGRSISVPLQGSPFIDVIRMCPTIPVREEDGSWGYGSAAYPTYGTNPIAMQEQTKNTQYNNRLLGNAYLQIEPIRGLQIKTSVGVEYFDYFDKIKKTFEQDRYLTEPTEFKNELTENNGERLSLTWENTIFYQNKIGDHAFDALVGYTAQRTDRHDNFVTTRNLLADGKFWELDQHGTKSNEWDMGGNRSTTVLTSILGRINYSYADRYLLQANIRRDGSSRFGSNYRYGIFPSVSVGWRISQESFMQNVRWIDDLKLRAGYGVLGDQQAVGDYAYAVYLHTSEGALLGQGTPVYYPGTIQKGFANSDLRWETRKTFNIGLDWTLLSQRLYGSFEYFNANVSDLLVKKELPWVTGTDNSDYPWVNYGSMRNQGFELALGWRDKAGDFTYDISLNLSHIRNTVIDLGGEDIHYSGVNVSEPGRSIGDFKVLRMDGIFQTQEEIDNYTWTDPETGVATPIQPKAQPGDVKYKDLNNDGKIDFNDNSEDREYVGSPFPTIQGGLNATFGWRGIDLSLFFYGVAGNYIYNSMRRTMESMDDVSNFPADLKPWTGPGTSNTTPRPLMKANDNTHAYSDRWIERGDYLRLKNLQLGYSLPKVWMDKTNFMENCRVYVSAENLFTITAYKGLDPEISGGSVYEKGRDGGHFPPVRTFSIGLQLGF